VSFLRLEAGLLGVYCSEALYETFNKCFLYLLFAGRVKKGSLGAILTLRLLESLPAGK
jgi:hypothetical protein